MPDDHSAAALLREAGLMADGPVTWGRHANLKNAGVFVIEMGTPMASPPMDLSLIGKWLERVPGLQLDNKRPTSKELQVRLNKFWLPSQPILFIGSSTGSVLGKVNAISKTLPGDAKPAWTGMWLHFLKGRADLRVWWAATDTPELYEVELLERFAAGVPAAERAALFVSDPVLPWAVLRTAAGDRKATGITGGVLAEVKDPEGKPITRIIHLPVGEADGARDEAKRRRPAVGRGTGRVAAAAGYAAQGSPRKAPEPVLLSPEGHERLEAELAALVVQRPEVIKRIATAREHGDLKENAEYHAAREEQGFLEGRIKTLEAKLKVAVIVAPTERGAQVERGSRLRVEGDGDEVKLTVVGGAEANSREGRISNVSPVGAALMGRRVGDAVTIVTPGGEIHYKILEID